MNYSEFKIKIIVCYIKKIIRGRGITTKILLKKISLKLKKPSFLKSLFLQISSSLLPPAPLPSPEKKEKKFGENFKAVPSSHQIYFSIMNKNEWTNEWKKRRKKHSRIIDNPALI